MQYFHIDLTAVLAQSTSISISCLNEFIIFKALTIIKSRRAHAMLKKDIKAIKLILLHFQFN